jgi:hypothetical protein
MYCKAKNKFRSDSKIFENFYFLEFTTLKSLIEEHARLDFSDFLSTLLAIFHVINEKVPPARLLIYLVNKQAGWHFFPSLLVYSG